MFYSQFGEDKILFDLFNKKTSGVCIEVGANNGIDGSTSFFFERVGWQCILVEPNPSLCHEMRKSRKSIIFSCAASSSRGTAVLDVVDGAERSDGLSTISPDEEYHARINNLGFVSRPVTVQTMTLDEILSDAGISGKIDFVSIDVEGHELEVLKGFSLDRWKPSILLIEDNTCFESSIISDYLKSEYGYVRFLRTGVNDWYAHRDNRKFVTFVSFAGMAWKRFFTRTKKRLKRIPLVQQFIKVLSFFRR